MEDNVIPFKKREDVIVVDKVPADEVPTVEETFRKAMADGFEEVMIVGIYKNGERGAYFNFKEEHVLLDLAEELLAILGQI